MTDQGTFTGKVIPFKSNHAIFNSELRQKIEASVKPYTDKPEETVSAVEQAICAHFIALARSAASDIGWKFARKLAETFSI